MKEQLKLETRQAIFLLFIVIYSTAEFILAKDSFEAARHDNWLVFILLGLFGIAVGYVVVKLSSMFKDKTIIQYSKDIVGKPLGFIIGMLYCIFFIQINSVIIREFGDLLAGPFYPTTPVWFFCVTIVSVAGYVVYKGIGIAGRISDVILPLYLVAIIMFPLANINSMDFSNLKPILADGIMPVVKASKTGTIWYGEIALLLMIFPLLKKSKQGYKVAFITIIILALFLFLSAVSLVALFGHELEALANPYLEMARYIKISDSFERPESFLLFIWSSSLVVKIAVFYHCAVKAIGQLFNMKKHNILIIPIGIILVILSLVTIKSSSFLTFLITKILVIPYLIMQFIIPTILLLIAKIRKVGDNS